MPRIKPPAPSGSHPLPSFAPFHSPSPAGAHHRAAETKGSPENESSSVRSSTGRGESCRRPSISLVLSGSRACLHPLDLIFLCFWTRTRRGSRLRRPSQEHIGTSPKPSRAPSPLHAHPRAAHPLLDPSASDLATTDRQPPFGKPASPEP
jgi:hypothetical protein